MENQQTTPQANRSFHTLITVLASSIILIGVALGIWFVVFYNNHEETNDAQVEQYVTPVMARVTGYIQEIRYEENQFVKKGDTLVVIDNREFKAKYDQALAELENAKLGHNVVSRNVATTANESPIRQAQLQAAKTEVWRTELEYKRYQALVDSQSATLQQLERVKSSFDAAQAKYTEVLSQIQSAKLQTIESEAKVPASQAVIDAKKAVYDNAALFLSYTVITAPYDGWVGKKIIQPGQMIKEGQNLVSIVSKEKWITANFKETQVQYLTVGQQVVLRADAIKDREFVGEIESLSPASGARFSLLPPDNATGNFIKIEQRIPVRIKIKDTDQQTEFLRAGINIIVIAEHN